LTGTGTGYKMMGSPTLHWGKQHDYGTLLYDVQSDPGQRQPLEDAVVEQRMVGLLKGVDAGVRSAA